MEAIATTAPRSELHAQTARRRTFAIISHPDAGKTTLTEKLLLYSGMIRTAGMVGSRKARKGATSDWMGMEQERGISITASAMQFPYKDVVINILDTPGHQDFSEDTYRTLTAADSVIMVLDAAKGVEAQTRKLFATCKLRRIPVFTFVNKMDMPAREPLDLMAEVEDVLGIHAAARNWPVGRDRAFRGVADADTGLLHLYEKTASGGAAIPREQRLSLADPQARVAVGDDVLAHLRDELDLLAAAGNPFRREDFLAGTVTPVFFGSALTNFGVEPLFDAFVRLAPPPGPRPATRSDDGEVLIDPETNDFSAYVFKLQANMNPRHRDCVAFMRIVSGRYERDMTVVHHPSGKRVRLSRPHTMLAAERGTLEEAWPGDIIGVISPGLFAIGDTISADGGFDFLPLPQFQPEHFATLRAKDTGRRKQLDQGLKQLAAEGTVQVLHDVRETGAYPLVAAVGSLQFDVLQYRLRDEYGVDTALDPMPFQCSAWLEGDAATFDLPFSAKLVRDRRERIMVLFTSPWQKEQAARDNPRHRLVDFA